MVDLERLFLTSGPVELVPSEPSSFAVPAKDVLPLFIAFYLIVVLSGLLLHMKRDPLFISLFKKEGGGAAFWAIVVIFLVGTTVQLASCDGRIASPALAVGLHPEVPHDTGLPQGAPVQIDEIPPEIPQLDQPLMTDETRSRELEQRLNMYFLGKHRHSWRDFVILLGMLEKQMLLEKKIEAALVDDGYNPINILFKRSEIRVIVFDHPTNENLMLSERTLDRYLSQIARNGTRQSIPYGRVVRAIRRYDIIL